jgi:hypothetical protein
MELEEVSLPALNTNDRQLAPEDTLDDEARRLIYENFEPTFDTPSSEH